jgi:hypothetical protein
MVTNLVLTHVRNANGGIGVRRGVSKGVEDSPDGRGGVAPLQSVEGLGMAGPGETLGSPWPSLTIRQ